HDTPRARGDRSGGAVQGIDWHGPVGGACPRPHQPLPARAPARARRAPAAPSHEGMDHGAQLAPVGGTATGVAVLDRISLPPPPQCLLSPGETGHGPRLGNAARAGLGVGAVEISGRGTSASCTRLRPGVASNAAHRVVASFASAREVPAQSVITFLLAFAQNVLAMNFDAPTVRSPVGSACGKPASIRLLIVSDVRLYREGLAHILAHEPRLGVVGTAADATAAT